jgi:hypothetical protein
MEILISCLTVTEKFNSLAQKYYTKDKSNKVGLTDKANLHIYKDYINTMDPGKIHNQLVEH